MPKHLVTLGVATSLLLSVLFVAAAPPVAAAPAPTLLTMDEGGGELQVRGQENSYQLESPTTYAATLDTGPGGTGAITAGALSTPTFSFDTKVLDGALDAFVDAKFTEVAPGTYTGSVSPGGDVVLRTALRADLHIDVPQAGLTADCSASPVMLEFLSTAPYDAPTGEVTVADADFTIPQFPVTAACESLVAGSLNEMLAGSGHSLVLDLSGDIELPPEPGDASVTALEANPSGGARFGDEVTLRAGVAPGPDSEAPEAPTGIVQFADDGDPIGTVALGGDGTAELSTSTLSVGSHTFTATYSGDSVYGASRSGGVAYDVAATPAVDVDLPSTVVIDGVAEDFTLTVENPQGAQGLDNFAVDVTFTKSGAFLRSGMLVLERRVSGDNWELVPLADSASIYEVGARIGPVPGRPLPAPGTISDDLRLSAAAMGSGGQPTPLGNVTARFDVVEVDPTSGETVDTLASTEGTVLVAGAERVSTTLVPDDFFGGPPVTPTVVRAGNTITLSSLFIEYAGTGATPQGSITASIDGIPVPLWYPSLGVDGDPEMSAPLPNGFATPQVVVDLPPTLGTGVHTVLVEYSGDSLFLPSSHAATFTVVPRRDALYDCVVDSALPYRFRAQVRGFARLPVSVPTGAEATLRGLDVEFVIDRSFDHVVQVFGAFLDTTSTPVGGPDLEAVEFGFGDATGTAASATMTGSDQTDPSDPEPDVLISFDGETASVPIAGDPGTTVPVDLDRIELKGRTIFGGTLDVTCVPNTTAVRLGTVIVAGTTLSVEGPSPLRSDEKVGLRATVAPSTVAGQVEFSDNGEVIAIAPLREGQALSRVSLAPGTHNLVARTRAGASGPSTTSEAVTVEVLPEFDCAASAEEGSAAVVRLTYLELLGRCPDAAGLAYWTGELDDGVSSETFARRIAYSTEALGQVVDDGYQTILGRDADTAGRAYWVGRLRSNGRYDQLLADLAASNEFWVAAGSTNGGYVDLVYERVLDRPSDPDGRGYWLTQLYFGKSRRVMVTTFARLSEPLGRIVDGSFDEILGRAPMGAERTAEMSRLRTDGDRSGLYTRLIGTTEFFDRAQEFPNPED